MKIAPTTPLPPLRPEINGFELPTGHIVLFDELEYTKVRLQVAPDVLEYLPFLDGERSAEELARQAALAGRAFSVVDFLAVVNVLEEHFFLESQNFHRHKASVDNMYQSSAVRPTAHAGSSYPSDAASLRKMLDGFLASGHSESSGKPPIAIVAPHIDLRVGGESYAPAYNRIRRSDADLFIIFGVSHLMSYDDLMISEKDFATPLGNVRTDREFIEHYRRSLPFKLTKDESAHRIEHSIEFQTVFLQHILGHRDFAIVPILTGSLHEYVEGGQGNARENERLTTLYETLYSTAQALGRNVCFIAGADLCHVGKKFGDRVPARRMLAAVRKFDLDALAHVANPDAEKFLGAITTVRNKFRVCGVSPIYATLRSSKACSGELLCYDQWDEQETESAVTFAGVALYE